MSNSEVPGAPGASRLEPPLLPHIAVVAAGVVLRYTIRRSCDEASALPPDHPGLRHPQAG
jgi:hypothetical protein